MKLDNKYTPFILCFVLGIIIGFYLPRGDHRDLRPNMSDSSSGLVSSTSTLSASQKTSESEPDLVVSQKYTAEINGKKVSVPIAQGTTNTTGQPNSPSGSSNVQGQLTQTIDLTNVLSKLRPSWEIGIGYNYLDNKHYGVLSIQRNYKNDKALDLTCQIRDNQVKGIMVQHKWLIK